LIDLSACAISGRGPSVWTGRALQAEGDDLESWSCASVSGLLMEPLSFWPSRISARVRSHSRLSPEGQKGHLITNAPKTAVNQPRRRVHCAVMGSFFRCSVCGHQFLPPALNQKALRNSPSSLAKFTVIRRASSRVSRFGRRAVRRSNIPESGEKRKCAACA
jgi:hypothetical protein